MKKLKNFLLPLLLCLVFLNCQKDDICPEGTEVTPLLIIEFYDDEDEETLTAVQGLLLQAIGEEDTLFGPVTTNRISIPLRTNENATSYRFIRNSGTDTENVDTISFSYNPSPEYLNRACGFVVNYLDMDVEIIEDEENWILTESVEQNDIINETEDAHIFLTH
ncbi:DUF6452 family protein [Salinimicrobium sp. GXAS 041]|uniref:DUF6452 family protein n=1 Tax=Salinimicrobium sp. GXAS 041 TaxID=3400806 RepID=UPI003C785AC5